MPARDLAISALAVAGVVAGLALLSPSPSDAGSRCLGKRATITGTSGRNRIKGEGGNDFLDGRRNENGDVLKGGPGNDEQLGGRISDGGAGDDFISGDGYESGGTDRLRGGPGDDEIHGDYDARGNVIDGGPGSDLCDEAVGRSRVRNCEG